MALAHDRMRQAFAQCVTRRGVAPTLTYIGDALFRQLAPDTEQLARVAHEALARAAVGKVAVQPTQGLILGRRATLRGTCVNVPWTGAGVVLAASGAAAADGIVNVVMVDRETARPRSLVGGAWLAPTVAAASASVAARCLARPDAGSLALVGDAPAGRAVVMTLARELPLRELRISDPDPEVAQSCAVELMDALEIPALVVNRPALAGADSDIVVTGSRALNHGLTTLMRGALVCATGGKSGLGDAVWANADRTICELAEAGGSRATEGLAPVVAGRAPARTDADERLIWVHRPHPAVVLAVAAYVERLAADRMLQGSPVV